METKRMRVFAGPNGSGKSTSLKGILGEKEIKLGVYINADDIESELNAHSNALDLIPFKVSPSTEEIQKFFKNSAFSPEKRIEPDLWQKISINQKKLNIYSELDSYLAADLAEFLRQSLLNKGVSFTFETVMSHTSKISFMKEARFDGFKVYLYFVATEDFKINMSRVNLRVSQDGHPVPSEKIKERYFKSLQNLKQAVKNSDRAFIFDNSGSKPIFIAEITQGSEIQLDNEDVVPNWVSEYLLN